MPGNRPPCNTSTKWATTWAGTAAIKTMEPPKAPKTPKKAFFNSVISVSSVVPNSLLTTQYDAKRRVAVVYENFVVVVAMGLRQDGSLKANFVTCYQAENSIGKIRSSPAWSRGECLLLLGGGL